jgi:hypothetical protein
MEEWLDQQVKSQYSGNNECAQTDFNEIRFGGVPLCWTQVLTTADMKSNIFQDVSV